MLKKQKTKQSLADFEKIIPDDKSDHDSNQFEDMLDTSKKYSNLNFDDSLDFDKSKNDQSAYDMNEQSKISQNASQDYKQSFEEIQEQLDS